MTAFIAWVFAQANKVYLWFGSAFWELYNAVSNAYNWAVHFAGNALNSAINYAYNLFLNVRNDVRGLFDWVISQITRIRNDLADDFNSLTDWVRFQLTNISGIVSPLISNGLQSLYNFIDGIPLSIRNFIQNIVADIKSFINTSFGWILNIRERVFSLLDLLTPDRINSLLAFLQNWLNTIVLFFQNPLIFIFDLIREQFIPFVCFVLAWSLGTIKYDLPKSPPWRK